MFNRLHLQAERVSLDGSVCETLHVHCYKRVFITPVDRDAAPKVENVLRKRAHQVYPV